MVAAQVSRTGEAAMASEDLASESPQHDRAERGEAAAALARAKAIETRQQQLKELAAEVEAISQQAELLCSKGLPLPSWPPTVQV